MRASAEVEREPGKPVAVLLDTYPSRRLIAIATVSLVMAIVTVSTPGGFLHYAFLPDECPSLFDPAVALLLILLTLTAARPATRNLAIPLATGLSLSLLTLHLAASFLGEVAARRCLAVQLTWNRTIWHIGEALGFAFMFVLSLSSSRTVARPSERSIPIEKEADR